jgi:hypothetical protein
MLLQAKYIVRTSVEYLYKQIVTLVFIANFWNYCSVSLGAARLAWDGLKKSQTLIVFVRVGLSF